MKGMTRAIMQLGIFMICSQMLIHIRPNGSYQKYLKLLVSAMILIQLLTPLIRLVSGSEEAWDERIQSYEKQLEETMSRAKDSALKTQERLNQMTLEELKKRTQLSDRESRQTGEKEIEKVEIKIKQRE